MIPIMERASKDPYIIIRTRLNLFLYLTLDMYHHTIDTGCGP